MSSIKWESCQIGSQLISIPFHSCNLIEFPFQSKQRWNAQCFLFKQRSNFNQFEQINAFVFQAFFSSFFSFNFISHKILLRNLINKRTKEERKKTAKWFIIRTGYCFDSKIFFFFVNYVDFHVKWSKNKKFTYRLDGTWRVQKSHLTSISSSFGRT